MPKHQPMENADFTISAKPYSWKCAWCRAKSVEPTSNRALAVREARNHVSSVHPEKLSGIKEL